MPLELRLYSLLLDLQRWANSTLKRELQRSMAATLFGCGLGQLEGVAVDALRDGAAANALGADAERFVRTVGRSDVNVLQVRAELPAADAGHLGSHSAEVLCFPAMGHLIAHDGLLSTDLTLMGHGGLR
jgi:hypothetical protein